MLVSAERLQAALEAVGSCGRDPAGGYTRLAFSREEAAARALVARWLDELGFTVRTDAAGNLIARREGTRELPALAMGSHLDTVPRGGLFDGALGVVGAVECARVLAEHGAALRHPLEIIVFSDEEGTQLGGTFGSRAMAGMITEEELDQADYRGVSFADRIVGCGLDPQWIFTARRHPEEFRAFLELHVEQGPILHRLGIPIGVVTGIVGYRRFSVTLHGQANHAGTTPMNQRQDALVAASSAILALRNDVMQQAQTQGDGDSSYGTVFTVGAMNVEPGVHNVIPGKVTFPIDVRDMREDYLAGFEAHLRAHLDRTGLPYEVTSFSRKEPVPMAVEIQALISQAAQKRDLPCHHLTSGAGHDAMCMARLTPTGMIFVPSQGGLSHCPEESTSWADATAGVQVLLDTLLMLDET